MAFVTKGFSMRVRLIDSGRNETTQNYELTAPDYATAIIAAPIVIGYLEAVCAAGTVGYTISEGFINDALVLPVDNSVQVEVKAKLVMIDSVDPTKQHTWKIPAPETDVFLTLTGAGQNVVDITHQDVIDFANMFSIAGECYISDGEQIGDDLLIGGERVTHYKRRG